MKWFKHEAPSPIVVNSNPVIKKIKVPWITKWVEARRRYKLQSTVKKPSHIIKPLRKIQPVKFFFSSNRYKRLSGMKKLKSLPSYQNT